jgi:hypothetical protein
MCALVVSGNRVARLVAGEIDGVVIGGTTPAAGTFTALNATGGGALTGTWSDLGVVTTVDINGGTLDGVTIGGAATAALSATTGAFSSTLTVSGTSGAGVGTIRLVANVFKFQTGTGGFTVANSGNSADILTLSDAGALAVPGTLDVAGNVGMGAGAGVGHALEVVEDAADTDMGRFKYTSTTAPSASKGLRLWNSDTTASTDGGLVFSMSDNGGIERYAGSITVDKVGTWQSTDSTRDGQMRFNTALNGVIAERFRIKQTGFVNFTSDVEMAATLQVSGNIGFYGQAVTAKPTGVAVSAAGIHAALVTLNLISA